MDAALVLRALGDEPAQAKTVARAAGIPVDRTDAALRLLRAVDKAERTERGLWRAAS